MGLSAVPEPSCLAARWFRWPRRLYQNSIKMIHSLSFVPVLPVVFSGVLKCCGLLLCFSVELTCKSISGVLHTSCMSHLVAVYSTVCSVGFWHVFGIVWVADLLLTFAFSLGCSYRKESALAAFMFRYLDQIFSYTLFSLIVPSFSPSPHNLWSDLSEVWPFEVEKNNRSIEIQSRGAADFW